MYQSPYARVDSLKTQTQELAQDDEAQQPGLTAGNSISSAVADGIYEDANAVTNRQVPQPPLPAGEGIPVSLTPNTYEALHPEIVAKDGHQVIVPPVQRRWEYLSYDEEPIGSKVTEGNHNSKESSVLSMLSGNEEKVS